MRTIAFVLGLTTCLSAASLSAQATDARLQEFGRQLGRELGRTHAEFGGRWTVEALVGCSVPSRDQTCSFKDPLPTTMVGAVTRELATSLSTSSVEDAVAKASLTRKAISAGNRAAAKSFACGNPVEDGPLAKIVQLSQVRVSNDTIEAIVGVVQLGRLAGCPGGMTLYLATSTREAGVAPALVLREIGHFEIAVELPRKRQ